MTVLATVIVLGVLIFVHELGHFWAAKAVGIEVQRFSIGLGPKLFGFTRGETEYVISAIPLGGYVKMGGMDDEVMERMEGGEVGGPRREPRDSDFDAKPIWARTLVISAGVIMNMLFAFGVYVFLAANYGVQTYDSTRIGLVEAEGLPAGTEAFATVEPGSRVVAIDGESIDDWGDLESRLLDGPGGTTVVELVEPRRELTIDLPANREDRLELVRRVSVWLEAGVGFLAPGDPADDAGLEVGDRIVAVDGQPTLNWWTFVRQVESRPGQRVQVTVSRDEREVVRTVTLDAVEEEDAAGNVRTVGKIGISPPGIDVTYNRVGFEDAVVIGYRETVAVTGMILGFLRDLVTLNVSPRSVGSIVTIGEASGQAAEAGLDVFLRFMALFSINLAVLNLLPIPVLDGGHLVFLGIEAVRGGRGLSVEQKLKWSNVGFLIIVGIMVWALSNDFLRLFGL